MADIKPSFSVSSPNNSSSSQTSDEELMDKIKRKNEKKARLVQLLDRGIVHDRLHVQLPPGVYGEWVPDDKVEIYRMQSMGFKIDTEHASSRALHDGPSGESRVADVIFMTCDMETKELIDEIRDEQIDAANRPKGGKQREERDLENLAANVGLPSNIKSKISSADAKEIKDALTSN